MPHKTHKRKFKQQRRSSPPVEFVGEVTRPAQLLPVTPGPVISKQKSDIKSSLTADERRSVSHQYARSDMKRSLIMGGSAIILLIIVFLIFRYSPIGGAIGM
jgi:hypothetical protein